jgi:C-terminal processing protease CtpA/Prc
MRRFTGFGLLAAMVLLATPVLAGGSGEKCTYSTQDCLDMMASKLKTGGWVGIEMDKNEAGQWVITNVVPKSPAEEAGFQKEDILFALEGIEIANEANADALKKVRGEWKAGQLVHYTLKRSGVDRQVAVTLGSMPADLLARYIGEHMIEHASMVEKEAETAKKN